MPPNNKKQRGREDKKKRNEAQQAAQQKAEAEQAQQNTFRRTQFEVELQRKFGAPAIDTLIKDIAHSASTTATTVLPPAAAAAVLKSSSSNSKMEKEESVVCYHGSSAQQFVVGTSAFLKMVKSYVVLRKKFKFSIELNDASNKFLDDTENQQIMYNDEFPKFVFALGVSLYLKLPSADKESYRRLKMSKISTWGEMKQTASYELEMILQLGLVIKYDMISQTIGEKFNKEQLSKYFRDVEGERGIINCLYRETKHDCGCMKTKKVEANNMDKNVVCRQCRQEFPKELTKLCDGCERVVYCSKKCCIADWPRHQQFCKIEQKNKPKKNDKTKKNMTAVTTGTATSTTTESMSTPGAVGARTNKSQSSPTAIEEPPTTKVPTSVLSQRARRDTVLTTRAIPAGAQSPPAAVGIVPPSQTQKLAPTPKSISKPVLGPLGGNKPVATTASLPPSPTESVTKVDSGDEGKAE